MDSGGGGSFGTPLAYVQVYINCLLKSMLLIELLVDSPYKFFSKNTHVFP